MIRFDTVTRHYGDAESPALRDISVEFQRGDFVFLIGASGSGKSTLLRMILREALPQQGKVTVAGQNLSMMLERRVPGYRRSIGMVFQDFRLLPDKTVYDNVAFAMRVIGAPRSAIRKRVMKVLSRVNLDHLAKRYPHEISGGEQQRAAIARAIVNSPAILLADEPTGNLDPRASEEVMKILRWINDSGTTVIMATHDRAIVDRMRRRVVHLHRGELVRDEPQGLYDPPEGSTAWEMLAEEAAKTGLRAADPMPVRTELNPIVPAAVSSHADEQERAAHDDAQQETAEPSAEPPEEASRQNERAEASAQSPAPQGVHHFRVTWPEDAPEPDRHAEEPRAGVDAAAVPAADPDLNGADVHETSDLIGPEMDEQEPPSSPPDTPEPDTDALPTTAPPSSPGVISHAGNMSSAASPQPPEAVDAHRLNWLSQVPQTAAPTTPRPAPAAPPVEPSSVQNPAESTEQRPPRPVPRPRASAAEVTYSDSQRTAEQLRGSQRPGFFSRRRRRT